MKTKRIVEPFQTKYNQTIQPGDKVFAVTTRTHRVSVREAEYLGYVERKTYNYKTREYEMMKFAQIRSPSKKCVCYFKGTDTEAKWPYDPNAGEREWRAIPTTMISTLQYNRIFRAGSSAADLAAALM